MKSIPLTVVFDEEFEYVEGQTYYNEKLAFEILKHAAAMSDEGYEITFDDLADSWQAQDAIFAQQSNLLTSVAGEEELPAAWASRLSSLASLIPSLLAMAASPAGLTLRSAVSSLIELALSSAAGLIKQQVGGDEDLNETLKKALLKESFPGSGIYDQTLIESVQDLLYNNQVLDIPATPRPIKIHLQGKTIQQ